MKEQSKCSFIRAIRVNSWLKLLLRRHVVRVHEVVIKMMQIDLLETGFVQHFDAFFFAPHCTEARAAVG